MKRLIPILIGVLILGSCGNNNLENQNGKYQLVEYDSIIFDYNKSDIDVIDYNLSTAYYLAYSSQTGDIMVFDHKGKAVTCFNKMGEGPEEYKKVISLAFFQDSLIAITSYPNRLMLLNFNGVVTKDFNIGEANVFYYPIRRNLLVGKNEHNDNILLSTTIQHDLNMTEAAFYEKAKNVLMFNIAKDTFNLGVPFESDNAYRIQAKKGLSYGFNNVPFISSYKNDVFVIYPSDPKIYSYTIDNSSLKYSTSYSTNPEHFNEPSTVRFSGFASGDMEVQEAIKKNTFTNGFYSGIYCDENFQFLTYFADQNEDLYTPNDLIRNEKITNGEIVRGLFLQVFKNGKKLCPDIKINNVKYQYLSLIKSMDKIILKKNPISSEDNVIYIAKLVKN